MDREFWLERWQSAQIGFHSEATNVYLQRFWPDFRLPPHSRVLVPLCGKSKDILWLRDQGHDVVGVELSPLAVEAFFTENLLKVNKSSLPDFAVHQSECIVLYCGDFFALTAEELNGVNAVFDRAALVALPFEMRKQYVSHLRLLLKRGAKILLVVFDYDQKEMSGPPFGVTTEEIQVLYGRWCDITLYCSQDILAAEAHFLERGLSYLTEKVYAITVN